MSQKEVYVLVVNRGSSSVKGSLFLRGEAAELTEVQSWSIVQQEKADEAMLTTAPTKTDTPSSTTGTFESLCQMVFQTVEELTKGSLLFIGHRVTHGVGVYHEPIRLERKVLSVLTEHSSFAPHHLPSQVAMMEASLKAFPQAPQYACFDTTFFASLPQVAQQTGFPRKYEGKGIRRYGFHGLSYSYIIDHVQKVLAVPVEKKRIVIAHLGSGASVAAVQCGKPIDTTMSVTPNSGLPMSTRLGDLDAGAEAIFTQKFGITSKGFQNICHFESGLLGVSGYTADMERLISDSSHNQAAEEAVAYFCYAVKKQIAAMAAAMGGIDVLVFTGGMGDKAPVIRRRVCEGLKFLGINLDEEVNATNSSLISSNQSQVEIYTCPTNEAHVIAQASSLFLD